MADRYYDYDPSFAASVIFTVAFGISGAHHTFVLIKHRTWYFIPFLVGVLFQFSGYVARDISIKESPRTLGPYLAQIILILVAPAVYAASIYMVLGRLIRFLDAEHHSIIRTTWVTKIFVGGDVLSFLVQVAGGGMFGAAETVDQFNLAKNIILVGLIIQLIFFGLFIVVISIFHWRIVHQPTQRSMSIAVPWRRFILVLYVASGMILVRSVFRLIEYQMPRDSVLQTREVYFYVFDAALMITVAFIFNVFHPHQIVSRGRKDLIPMGDISNERVDRLV